jgi:apolipoprotein N-acyltransferase
VGLVFGVVHWGLLLIWIPWVVAPRFPWAYAGFGALVAILGGLSALLGWSVSRLHGRAHLPLALAFPLAWVAVEWAKGHVPFGLAWPWLGLGVSLTRWPDLLGVAEWVGEAGVSFWLALVNGLVAERILGAAGEGRRRGSAVGLTLLATLAVGPALLGWQRARTVTLEPGPRVAVVGTEVSPELRRFPLASAEESLVQVRSAFKRILPARVDLIILPEGTVPLPHDEPGAAPFLDSLRILAGELATPILVGVLGSGGGPGEGRYSGTALTNSAILLAPDPGLAYRYDKRRLVPGMEWGGFRPGGEPVPLVLGAWAFGPLVCYESLFEASARELRARGAQVLVNLTSDIWFGEGSSLPGSLFLAQHPAHLVLRAVENRMAVARAANGGATLVLDPRGRVLARASRLAASPLEATLRLHPSPTLFSRTGDLLGPTAALTVLLLLLASARGTGKGGPAGRVGKRGAASLPMTP